MGHLQLIRHQLVSMFAMSLPKILVKEYAVHNGQTAVNAVHQQENQPGDVTGPYNQHPDCKKQDESNPYTPDIPRKAFCLSARTEIEKREHKDTQQHNKTAIICSFRANLAFLLRFVLFDPFVFGNSLLER